MSQSDQKNQLDALRAQFGTSEKSDSDVAKLRRQLERVNQRLKDSEAVQSHFLSNIRCEINNPLTAIMGHCVYLISQGDIDLELRQQIARTIYNEAFDLDFQMQNIITAAELEAGEITPFLSRIDIRYLIDNLIETFQVRLHDKQLTLVLENSIPESRFFQCDAQKLHLILSNVISNAIEYSRDNIELKLIASLVDNNLVLSVRDNGIGIDASQLKAIFDRFRQIDQGATKQHKGHGLGLSVSKASLDLLNGTIEVKSEPNIGSIFTITIPEATDIHVAEDVSTDANTVLFSSPGNDG